MIGTLRSLSPLPMNHKKMGRRRHGRCTPKIIKFATIWLMVVLIVTLVWFNHLVTTNTSVGRTKKERLHHQHHFGRTHHSHNSTTDTGTGTGSHRASQPQPHQSQHQHQPQPQHHVAGLSCDKYGGPTSDDAIHEMIYWYHIPADSNYFSNQFRHPTTEQEQDQEEEERYLTFEPDEGGWNNIRMALETTIAMAISMRRTLVLPPDMKYYLLWDENKRQGPDRKNKTKKKKNVMNFDDFFHLESIQQEFPNVLRIIPMEEFLTKVAMKGQLRNRQNVVRYPHPTNASSLLSSRGAMKNSDSPEAHSLWEYIRDVTQPLQWDSEKCVAVFPSSTTTTKPSSDRSKTKDVDHDNEDDNDSIYDADTQRHLDYVKLILRSDEILYNDRLQKLPPHKRRSIRLYQYRQLSYRDDPTMVNATAVLRLAELLANRRELCVYNQSMHQQHKVLHMTGSSSIEASNRAGKNENGPETTSNRFLIHFYAFLFYENYHTDLFIKRFIRDHLRYIDEIQCGAARIIEAIRNTAESNHKRKTNQRVKLMNSTHRQYDSFHIRRGDFQYDLMHLSAQEIYEGTTREVVPDGRTVYIATDEKNLTFFEPFQQHYNILFLRNFTHLIADINPNYYGMIDQLVASKGEVFVGTYYSTFSGYINRLRGYHAQKNQLTGYELGHIQSYYYVPEQYAKFRDAMRSYLSVQQMFWQQEFPVAWRDINHDITEDMIQ